MSPRCRLFPALVAALALAIVPSASAAVGGFEGGDGNQDPATTCATALDWACLTAEQYGAAADTAGPNDLMFASSKRLDQPDNWAFTTGTVSPGKADIQGIWVSSPSTGASNFLDLAFKLAGGGSVFLGFELNQSTDAFTNAAGATVTCRHDGDLLVQYDAGTPSYGLWRWTVTPGGPVACPGWTGSFVSKGTLAAGNAELAVNTGDIPNSFPGFPATFTTGTFGEAALDLNALADATGSTACTFVKRIQVTTRTSGSFDSSSPLADFLQNDDVLAAACSTSAPQPTTAPTITSPAVTPAPCTTAGGSVAFSGTGQKAAAPDQPFNVILVEGTTIV